MKHLKKFNDVAIGNLLKDKNFIKYVHDKIGEDYTPIDLEDLNNGYCVLVAKYIKSKYPSAEIFTIGNVLNFHVFVKIGEKYYDGVDFEGVDRIEDLSFMKEFTSVKIASLQKGIPFDNEEEEEFSNNTHMAFISRNSPAGQSGKITTPPGSKPSQMPASEYDRKINPALKTLNKKPPVLKQSGKQI